MTSQRKPQQHRPAGPERPPQRPQRMAAARGFVEAVRRIPAAFRRPETLMLAMAIFASIGMHMPPYVGLGALADYWKELEAKRKKTLPPAEVSFEIDDSVEPELPKPEDKGEPPEPEKAKEKKPEKKEKELEKVAQPEPPPQPQPQPKAEPEPEPKNVAEVQVQPPPPPPDQKRRQSITQKSDEKVEPPPDARFLAEESRRVEEETVAMVRDELRDDAEPEAAAPEDRGVDEAGGDEENADGYHEQGEDEGEKLAEVPEAKPSQAPEPEPEQASQAAQSAQSSREAQQAVAEQREAAPSLPGTVIKDPLGSFTLATADEPRERRQGQAARDGRAGRLASAGQARNAGKPNLGVSWRVFEDTYDAETLARERTPKRRKRSGSSQRQQRWKEFRAAIENYVVGVRPGNQTALNAAADPFAAYLASFHRHLHMEFAHRFLGSLPATGELSDQNLVTKVEIVVNSDGTLHRVGVLRTSGQIMFDFGAFNAVKSGEPYPQPPAPIRSADGRVYMHWDLHRDHSQCGTWNAELFILKDPPDVTEGGVLVPPGMQLGPRRHGPG